MTHSEALRVVFFKDGEKWVAQCLEYDIGAQADDVDTLKTLLDVVLSAECSESMARHGVPFQGIPKAPAKYEQMWQRQSSVFKPASNVCSQNYGVELALVA